jgi:hypothetical protein
MDEGHTNDENEPSSRGRGGAADEGGARTLTVRDAILHAASLTGSGGTIIIVHGKIVAFDEEVGRIDISEGGAKLIVDASNATLKEGLAVGDEISVTGKLMRKQRRLYMVAQEISSRIIL